MVIKSEDERLTIQKIARALHDDRKERQSRLDDEQQRYQTTLGRSAHR